MELNNSSSEPMDIDLSSNSTSAMDISYNENIVIKTEDKRNITEVTPSDKSLLPETKFKKLVVNLHVKEVQRKNKNNFLYTLGIFFLLLSGIFYHLKITYQCCEKIDTGRIRHHLTNRLYGQATAVSKIMDTLENGIKNKILIMYGGTGVGKTLTVSIILEDILNFSNVYHYTMLNLIDIAAFDLVFGLAWCDSSILIVDDVRQNDIKAVKEFIKTLMIKSKNLNKNVLVIMNYNCDTIDTDFSSKCDSNIENELKHNFSDIYVEKSFIEFSRLDNNVLRQCVEYEIGTKTVTEEEIQHILNNFNVARDGCKGVHQKIKYLNII